MHLSGLATAVDSLLAVKRAVCEERRVSPDDLARALAADFEGFEDLRRHLSDRIPSYGSDSREVLDMTARLGRMWADEAWATPEGPAGTRLRPGFHSWLWNIEFGRETGATPDGRRAGEILSSDWLPSRGKGRAPTAVLRLMAALPHAETCSGGSTLALDGTHFQGEAGAARLAALVEGFFAMGGPQLHLVMHDRATLLDAVENPERHADLLVRVTGFSEYFVRLLPDVQRDVVRRAER